MAEGMKDIRLSTRASDVAQQFVDEGWFANRSDVALFAASYVIRTMFDSFDPLEYIPPDVGGSNYSYGTFDSDGKREELLRNLYNTDNPRLCLRNLMIFGLESMGDVVEKSGTINIPDFLK